MTIERAFAIRADPEEVWDALWSELGRGDPDLYTVEASNWPRHLAVSVTLGGMPALVTYDIERQAEFTEVLARIEPRSSRYALFQVLTFGHYRRNLEMVLTQGLYNLKMALEGDEGGAEEDEDIEPPTAP